MHQRDLKPLLADFPLVTERMMYVAHKRYVRLASLNEDMDMDDLTEEQLKDEEDAATL